MQKHKNTHQDTNKEEELRTTPSERTIFFNANEDDIDFFCGKATFNGTGTFNKHTNRATPAKRTNGGSRVKTIV
jgi:hypothetical protein